MYYMDNYGYFVVYPTSWEGAALTQILHVNYYTLVNGMLHATVLLL